MLRRTRPYRYTSALCAFLLSVFYFRYHIPLTQLPFRASVSRSAVLNPKKYLTEERLMSEASEINDRQTRFRSFPASGGVDPAVSSRSNRDRSDPSMFQQPAERSYRHSDYSTCGHRRPDSESAGHPGKRLSRKLIAASSAIAAVKVKDGGHRWIQEEALLPPLR